MKKYMPLLLVIFFGCQFVGAQVPKPVEPGQAVGQSVGAQQAPIAAQVEAKGQKAAATLQSVSDKIPLSVPAWALAIITFLIELAMRFFPTVKPRSLFILVSQIFGLIGSIFSKLSSLLDQVVQNVKEEPGPKV
jgi:hypothetical protein